MLLPIHNKFPTVKSGKILIFSLLTIVAFFGVFGYLISTIIRIVMKMQLRITPETMTRQTFEKIPFPIKFNLYIFNITNKDEVLAGGKPILQELGPYNFEQYIDKFDIVDNKEEDTIEYEFRNMHFYKPENNGPGLTGDEEVTVAHPFLLSTILLIHIGRPDLIDFIQRALNKILDNPQNIFFTGRLWDFLFRGIVLDCSSEDFEVTAVCSEFDSGVAAEVKRFNETSFKFSMFGNMNGSSIGRFKVFRGKQNIRDLGRVVEFNGASEMDAWYEDECNQISGTDGTIFPPFMEKEDGFSIFIPQMCRIMTAEYKHPSEHAGIETNRFEMSFDVSKYGSPNCYCRDGELCPPKGITDLFPCLGTPIAISAPHFYKVDPSVAEKVIGLSPDREKHEYTMDFYQFAGVPLKVNARFQVNINVVPIKKVPYMQDLQPMFLPVMWCDVGIELPKKYVNMLKYQLVLGLKIQRQLRWVSFILGVTGGILGLLAAFIQIDNGGNGPHKISAKSDTNRLVDNSTVLSVEDISND